MAAALTVLSMAVVETLSLAAVAVAYVAAIFLIVKLIRDKRSLEGKLGQANAKIELHAEEMEKLRVDIDRQVDERTVGILKMNEQFNNQFREMRREAERQEQLVHELKELLKVKSTSDFLPICSHCKDIRDQNGYWHPIEDFIQNLSSSDFSHTLCPDCTKELYPDLFEGGAKPFCLSWHPPKTGEE